MTRRHRKPPAGPFHFHPRPHPPHPTRSLTTFARSPTGRRSCSLALLAVRAATSKPSLVTLAKTSRNFGAAPRATWPGARGATDVANRATRGKAGSLAFSRACERRPRTKSTSRSRRHSSARQRAPALHGREHGPAPRRGPCDHGGGQAPWRNERAKRARFGVNAVNENRVWRTGSVATREPPSRSVRRPYPTERARGW